ncbi:hypothetical protein COP1_013923 [Malus domestica]
MMRNKKPDDDKECFCGEDASQALRDRLMSRGADGEDDFLFMSCVQSALRCNVEELDLDIGHGRVDANPPESRTMVDRMGDLQTMLPITSFPTLLSHTCPVSNVSRNNAKNCPVSVFCLSFWIFEVSICGSQLYGSS